MSRHQCHYSDLVFSADLIGYENESARIYLLFEHKSSPEPMTAVQVLKYMALQWLELQEQHMLINGKLPPIIPVVIYQGQEDARRMCPSFQDLVDMPSEVSMVTLIEPPMVTLMEPFLTDFELCCNFLV